MKTRRVLLLIPIFLAFVFALILRWQWQNAEPIPVAPNRPDAPHLRWRDASKAERSAAIAPIRAQLEAFRTDDYTKAMTFQSQEMQRQFTSTQTFRAMMKRGYPQFAAPKSYDFGPARATSNAGFVTVPIVLKGADGVTVRAEYLMKKERGGYRVSGVQGGNAMPKMPPPRQKTTAPDMTI